MWDRSPAVEDPHADPPLGEADQTEFPAWSSRSLIKVLISGGLLALLVYQADPTTLFVKARSASPAWLILALVVYFVMILISAWRWHRLLSAQGVSVTVRQLVDSYLVATFFNNFLPSNIGGDVIRIKDTVAPTGSRTAAATVVLVDRAIGLLGLLVIAAGAASALGRTAQAALPVSSQVLWVLTVLGLLGLAAPVVAPHLVSRTLRPLRLARSDWIGARLDRVERMVKAFGSQPAALLECFIGALVVQALLVAFYAAVAASLMIPISAVHLAVLVPVSFIVQLLPVSVNGLGVREATFMAYFRMLSLPTDSALLLSLVATAVVMAFSLSGAVVYALRREPLRAVQ